MVFSMNVFKNKKRWKNKKTLKTFKKRALNKKRKKNVFYIYDVRIWIGHHYHMSMLACQYNQPKRPGDLDLERGVRVTCDVGYLCANFGLHRPLCSRVRPDVWHRQTSDKSIA